MEPAADWSPALPASPDPDYCLALQAHLDAASRRPPAEMPAALPQAVCLAILKRCERLVKAEPTLLQIDPQGADEVVVVGDLHGQFHDLLTVFQQTGHPSPQRAYVFDGDFVDRGAWGLEIVLLLCAWKLALPHRCFLVRGNHETTFCSYVYGFRREVLAKYGDGPAGEAILKAAKKIFMQLPLAAVIAGSTLVVHGGLPRAPPRRATRQRSSAPQGADQIEVASLADIAAAYKGGDDPEPTQEEQRLAADLLWSDPRSQPGIQLGARPGDVGILFGPDITEGFLQSNGLRLILRGHEGPDARVLRPDMKSMSEGYTLDHDTPSGKLYTVFSAPRYPQFGEQHDNLGAVAVLTPPTYHQPRFQQYSAAPRPKAKPFYDIRPLSSEESGGEFERASSEESEGAGWVGPQQGNGSQLQAAAELLETAAQAGTLQAQQGGGEGVQAATAATAAGGAGGGADGGLSSRGQDLGVEAVPGSSGSNGGSGSSKSGGEEPAAKRQRHEAERDTDPAAMPAGAAAVPAPVQVVASSYVAALDAAVSAAYSEAVPGLPAAAVAEEAITAEPAAADVAAGALETPGDTAA